MSKYREEELLWYMIERHAIRRRRVAGESPPFTDDPILRDYRFTCVDREHDAVTIWIKRNWRKPYADDPHLWFAMAVSRLLNLPESLAALGYPVPWDPERWTEVLKAREAAGERVFNPAYQIGTGSKKARSKIEFLRDQVLTPIWNRRERITARLRGASLAQAAEVFLACPGFAGFMTGQVIADVKHTRILWRALDWWTWAASGPGSRRGMN